MNFVNNITSLPSLLMDKFSSVFLISDGFLESFFSSNSIFIKLFRIVLQFFYFTCKWLMYMIDIIYFYFLQLIGVTSDTTIFDSARTDPTFRLLIDNKEEVTTVIKNFIVIAIILIIVTAIIAIIKLQAQASKESKTRKTPTGDVLRSMMKSIILIIITPLIALLGIIASSVMLQGLYRATNLSDAKSLSGRIFNVSAMSANKYRSYADSGVRIPIKFKFSGENKDDAIVYAANMLGKNSFPSLDYFNENESFNGAFYDPVFTDEKIEKGEYKSGADAWLNEKYYKYFDTSDDYNPNYSIEKYKIMKTHANEYYAMSDVIGYAMDTMEPYYFVTIQELLESVKDDEELLKELIDGYKILPLDGSGNVKSYNPETAANYIKNEDYSFIQYTSQYEDGEHVYVHVKDALDEMEGAKFTIAYKETKNGDVYTPVLYGDYIKVGTDEYKPIEKFFYRENEKTRFKKVDLYYEFNSHNGRYEKATQYTAGNAYYYRIGEDYILIDESNENKFYYRLGDGTYTNYTIGSTNTFYVATKIEYFLPLVGGVSVNKNTTFRSDYIEPANIITARGIFDESTYPTAIRRTNNGYIMFYRDDLEVVTQGSVSDVGKLEEIEAESEEDEEEDKGFFAKVGGAIKSAWNSVKTFVTSIFNPLKMVPDLAIDESRMASTYTNKTKSVAQLEDGKMHISYFFSDSVTSKLTRNMYALNLNNLYEPLSINYIVLVFASIVLFKVMLTAIFGLINRAISLFMLILIYPLACSTIPIDDVSGVKSKASGYGKWSDRYTRLLFSTFGLLLGINFVFIIIPVIDKIEFFTPESFQNNKALARITEALSDPRRLFGLNELLESIGFNVTLKEPNYRLTCSFANWLLRIIFQIAAFSLITSSSGKGGADGNFFSVIQNIVKPGGEGVLEDSPLDAVKKLMKTMSTAVNMMFFPGKALKNIVEKGKDTLKPAKDFLKNGSFVSQEAKKKMEEINTRSAQDSARKELLMALRNKAPKKDVEDKLSRFKSTHNVK